MAAAAASAGQDDAAVVRIAVLTQLVDRPPALSNLEPPPDDSGLLGARMAIAENNTTGRFMKQRFEVRETVVPADGDAVAAFKALTGDGYRFIVANLGADTLLRVADLPEAGKVLIFNAGAADDALRNEECRANILHTVPSRAMIADALAQFLAWKRWSKWFLVVGRRAEDRLFADAIRRAAKRFGTRIVAEKTWEFGPDTRRTAQSEVPVFTQDVDYDVLIVADEVGEFGEYLMYRTWTPRPVAGTQGLVPTSWDRAHERWGAAQLQSRFLKTFKRRMNRLDYTVWAAVRAVGEGATRAASTEFQDIADYILGAKFGLAGFKGQRLTFRRWNGQLRQPILLATPKAMVSVSPQKGYLHPRSYLDTLGYDEPESKCRR
ncbi:MAG: ABC transporter substrate-binding protein [Proteobacteria bacterium]|nr:ABC transporter substrate-binding protein [Pseudomonadota bacterium]